MASPHSSATPAAMPIYKTLLPFFSPNFSDGACMEGLGTRLVLCSAVKQRRTRSRAVGVTVPIAIVMTRTLLYVYGSMNTCPEPAYARPPPYPSC